MCVFVWNLSISAAAALCLFCSIRPRVPLLLCRQRWGEVWCVLLSFQQVVHHLCAFRYHLWAGYKTASNTMIERVIKADELRRSDMLHSYPGIQAKCLLTSRIVLKVLFLEVNCVFFCVCKCVCVFLYIKCTLYVCVSALLLHVASDLNQHLIIFHMWHMR